MSARNAANVAGMGTPVGRPSRGSSASLRGGSSPLGARLDRPDAQQVGGHWFEPSNAHRESPGNGAFPGACWETQECARGYGAETTRTVRETSSWVSKARHLWPLADQAGPRGRARWAMPGRASPQPSGRQLVLVLECGRDVSRTHHQPRDLSDLRTARSCWRSCSLGFPRAFAGIRFGRLEEQR